MEFFPEINLDCRAAEALARGLFAVAAVDGVHEAEAALIASFWSDTGGEGQALAELSRATPITPQELAAALATEQERRLFVKTAILLAWTDGQVTDKERRIVGEFADALGVDHGSRQVLDDQVKDFMLAQLAHLHNTDATLAVARKLGL